MRLRVLGCSGGIGDGRHTTSFLLGGDVLIDAGSGVTTLARHELLAIDHVFVTHSHLDHILALPLLLDSVGPERARPVTLHALPEVVEILRDHLFNWRIWPDFSRIPSAERPFLNFHPLAMGHAVELGARRITPIPAAHVVPACGYLMENLATGGGAILFSGDTEAHDALWDLANRTANPRHLIVECSFVNAAEDIARASKHYHPRALCEDLRKLRADCAVHITHLKPGGEDAIMAELDAASPRPVHRLEQGAVLMA